MNELMPTPTASAGVSLVIPAFNEEPVIVETIRRARVALAAEDADLMVVDDGSTDATAAEAEKAGARVLRHPQNMGYGRALKTGISAARHDTIVITDSDGTYPLEEIPRLLAEYRRGFDLVVGARQGEHYDESPGKKFLRRVLRRLVEFVTGNRIPDINSGLRIFSRRTIRSYFDTLCDTFSFTTSMTLAYLMTGKFVCYAPISYHRRIGRTKVSLWRDSLRTLQFIVEAILYYNPLKLYLVVAAPLAVLSALCFLGAGLVRPALLVILGALLLLAAILVLGLGMLAIMLKQILRVLKAMSGGGD